MKPGRYDIELYDGDSYRGPLIVLPDLTPFGGPPDLTAATVRAQIRASAEAEVAFPFAVEPVNLAARQIRLALTAPEALAAPAGVWDLQVSQTMAVAGGPTHEFVGTVLSGRVEKTRQVTR